jgi:hypothetical protein
MEEAAVKFDLRRLSQLDRVVAGAAIVVFISGLLPWWGYSGPLEVYSASVIGWNAGFAAWLGILLLVAAAVYLVLLRSEVALPVLPVGPAMLVAGAAAVGLLLIILRWLTLPRVGEGLAGSIGPKYGLYVALIAGIVEVGAAVMAARASGEPLPWAQRRGS